MHIGATEYVYGFRYYHPATHPKKSKQTERNRQKWPDKIDINRKGLKQKEAQKKYRNRDEQTEKDRRGQNKKHQKQTETYEQTQINGLKVR